MGILDDAIREHLELKRRRGTDPGEIERLEREALGPVRRTGQEPEDLALEDELESAAAYREEELGYPDQEPAPRWTQPGQASEFPNHGATLDRDEELYEDEEWEVPEAGAVKGGIGVEPDIAAPAPPVPPAPAGPAAGRRPIYEDDHLDQETLEHDVEDEEPGERHDPQAPGQADDMLEETPEFLQDTPDHDRLWFEQRPPRDFDLDG